MASPLQRVASSLGLRRSDPPGAPRPDDRTLLQVLIGAAFGGLVAGGLSALLGSGLVSAIVFGLLIGVLFLTMDLRARRDRDGPGGSGGPPPAV